MVGLIRSSRVPPLEPLLAAVICLLTPFGGAAGTAQRQADSERLRKSSTSSEPETKAAKDPLRGDAAPICPSSRSRGRRCRLHSCPFDHRLSMIGTAPRSCGFTAAARALEDRRAWVEAAALLQDALRLDPDSIAVAHRLTRIYIGTLGRPDLAVQYGKRVLAIQPGDSQTLIQLVDYYNRHDAAGAEALLNAVLANPNLERHARGGCSPSTSWASCTRAGCISQVRRPLHLRRCLRDSTISQRIAFPPLISSASWATTPPPPISISGWSFWPLTATSWPSRPSSGQL